MIDKWWRAIREVVRNDNCEERVSKHKPPAHAIPINRPDGTPYMHVWSDTKANRVCMMFSNLPGVVTRWSAVTLPDLIPALERVHAEFEQAK